jgi:pterin-4a-carbinolamine dehydratase
MSDDTLVSITKDWVHERCEACNRETKKIPVLQVDYTLTDPNQAKQFGGWHVLGTPARFVGDTTNQLYAPAIAKTWKFKTYKLARMFVNLVADLCDLHNHHADITFSYDYVTVVFKTHSISAVSQNDLIMAAQVNAIDMDWFAHAQEGLARTE